MGERLSASSRQGSPDALAEVTCTVGGLRSSIYLAPGQHRGHGLELSGRADRNRRGGGHPSLLSRPSNRVGDLLAPRRGVELEKPPVGTSIQKIVERHHGFIRCQFFQRVGLWRFAAE